MSFLSRASSGPPEKRALAQFGNIPKWSEVSGGGYGYAGTQDAMKLATFFRCVDLLSSTVANLPLKAYRPDGDGRKEVSSLLIDSPHPDVIQWDWIYMLMQSLLTTGNAFGYVTSRNAAGYPTAILPVHPDSVRIDPESGTWSRPTYEIGGKSVDSADMFHVKAFATPGAAMGLSPLEYLAMTLDMSFAADNYGLRWFKDSANPSGILSTEQPLEPTQMAMAAAQWERSHQNRRKPAFLGGGLKWQSISITPEESQFLMTKAQNRADIAMWFGVPPHMLGDTQKSTSWGSGISELKLGFQTFTMARFVVRIEQAFKLLLPGKQYAKFNMDALLRPDPKTRAEIHQMGRNAGYLSANDIRRDEEMPPIPNGDIYLQPMNEIEMGTPPDEYPGSQNNQPAAGEEGNTP